MNKEDRDAMQELKTSVALINAWVKSNESLKDEINEIKQEIAPIKKTVDNVMTSFYWFLRIVGGALIIYVIHHYLEPHDDNSDDTNDHKHNMGNSIIYEYDKRVCTSLLHRG